MAGACIGQANTGRNQTKEYNMKNVAYNDLDPIYRSAIAGSCGFTDVNSHDWDRAYDAGCFEQCRTIGDYAEAFLKYQLWAIQDRRSEVAEAMTSTNPRPGHTYWIVEIEPETRRSQEYDWYCTHGEAKSRAERASLERDYIYAVQDHLGKALCAYQDGKQVK